MWHPAVCYSSATHWNQLAARSARMACDGVWRIIADSRRQKLSHDFKVFQITALCAITIASVGVDIQRSGKTATCVLNQAENERGTVNLMTGQKTSRRALLRAFAATTVAAAPVCANAFGFLRGAGDIRSLRMRNGRTGETLNMTYWIDGDYIAPALDEINYFMRDWRTDSVRDIDTRTIDIMAASHRVLEANEPYLLLSGYRSPETNAMLRARSSGVARNSLHMQGQAADLRLAGRSVSQMARAAASFNAGGVGRYSGSNFVHMDCGPVRSWGR